MTTASHLVTVWNPAYATDPLEAHLRVLLDWDARVGAATDDEDDEDDDEVYVWWGKVKSGQRQQPMPHLDDVLALEGAAGDDAEVHLYLTDFRSLYVADVHMITTTDPRAGDSAHVPEYYTKHHLTCDCWFLLRDIRALVRDDLEGVTAELAQLRNARYHDRPVSIYGGMVELPLLVSRPDGRRFFDRSERTLLANGRRWTRFDAEQGGVGAWAATLRDDHLGDRAWAALDVSARQFLATGERTMREHRRERGTDLSPVLVSYGKAIEVQVNQLLRRAMRNAPPAAQRVKIGDHTRLLSDALPLTLGQLSYILGGEPALGDYLRTTLADGAWFTGAFAAIIDEFASVRNPAAHGETVDRATVVMWRNRLLGVGCDCVIGRLALVVQR